RAVGREASTTSSRRRPVSGSRWLTPTKTVVREAREHAPVVRLDILEGHRPDHQGCEAHRREDLVPLDVLRAEVGSLFPAVDGFLPVAETIEPGVLVAVHVIEEEPPAQVHDRSAQ